MDKNVAKQLVEARTSLREKIRTLKSNIAESKEHLAATFSPLSEPLKEIASKLEKNKLQPNEILGDFDVPDIKAESSSIPSYHIKKRKYSKIHRKPQKLDDTILQPTEQKRELTFLEDEETFVESPIHSTRIEAEHEDSKTDFEKEEVVDSEEDDDDEAKVTLPMYHAQEILKEELNSPEVQSVLQQFHELPRNYLIYFKTHTKVDRDEKYGVHEVDGNLYIGNSEIEFEEADIKINNKLYRGTKGLYELLFKKNLVNLLKWIAETIETYCNELTLHMYNTIQLKA